MTPEMQNKVLELFRVRKQYKTQMKIMDMLPEYK